MIKLSKKNQYLLIVLCTLLFLINSFYVYSHRDVSSGFFFYRLSLLIFNINHGFDLTEGFTSFLFCPFLLAAISLITGYSLIDVVYLPLIQIIAFFSILLFSKIFISNIIHRLIITFSVFIYVFALSSHFVEYSMAMVSYIYFAYAFYKYLYCIPLRVNYLILSLGFYAGVKFYGPPMEIWILTLVFTYFLLFYFFELNHFSKNKYEQLNKVSLNFIILLLVLWLSYNPKLYGQFFYRSLDLAVFVNTFSSFITGLLFPSNYVSLEPFEYIRTLPKGLLIIDLIYNLLCVVPLLLLFSYSALIEKNAFFWGKNTKSIFAVSLTIPFVADFALYTTLGLVTIRYVILIFPFIVVYFSNIKFKKLGTCLLVIFLILGSGDYFLSLNDNAQTVAPNAVEVNPFISFFAKNIASEDQIMVDHRTYGYLRSFFSLNINQPSYFKFKAYTSYGYEQILGLNQIDNTSFDFLIVNIINLNKPIQQGEPNWTYYEPLSNYYILLNNNIDLCKIYDSKSFEIYMPHF